MTEPVLAVHGLQKSFGALKATNNVSLDLYSGEIHALIGPNGAGKSTLISQIAGSLAPDHGEIELMGQTVTKLSVAKRAKLGLGRSFQVSSLAPQWSARRNVMLPLQARAGSSFHFWSIQRRERRLRDQAQELLDRVGLGARADVLTSDLSHGERRQLEVACALALRPKVLLLDEPMAGLGPEGSRLMTGFLESLKKDVPILLIEHDMDAVFTLASRISVLVYGEIIKTGSVDVVRSDKAVREAYLGEEG